MDLIKEISEVENELIGLVYLKPTWGLSFRVDMHDSRNKGQGDEFLQKLKITISEYTNSARHDADETAFKKTEAFVKIAKNILIAPIETSIKIALFAKFNIIGFMFDRTVQNYLICNSVLQDFLNHLDDFKNKLKDEELIAWNSSTFGGKSQVVRFSGILEGICLAARGLGHNEMIDPYEKLEENDTEYMIAKENDLSVQDIIGEIRSKPESSVELKKELIFKGESIANSSDDYLTLGVYASHDDILGDKSWGKVLFEKSLKKAISNINAQINSEYDTISASEISDLAFEVSVPSQLGDKVWAKELFELALEHDTCVTNLNSMASTVANEKVLDDKAFARRILQKAWDIYSNGIDNCLFQEIVDSCGLLAHEDVGNDKQQAEKWLDQLQNNITDPEDYLHLGKCWGYDKTMNNKDRARYYFKQALREPDGVDNTETEFSCLPYYKVALQALAFDVLNDPDWAADISEKYFQRITFYEDLIGISSIAFHRSEKLARMILEHMEHLIVNDENANSNDYAVLASHVSDKRLHPRPMFEDKEWGKRLFEQALERAETSEDDEKIRETMAKHL